MYGSVLAEVVPVITTVSRISSEGVIQSSFDDPAVAAGHIKALSWLDQQLGFTAAYIETSDCPPRHSATGSESSS